jgi:hypothetical protein
MVRTWDLLLIDRATSEREASRRRKKIPRPKARHFLRSELRK